MVSAGKIATSGARGKLKKIQRLWEDGGEAVPTSVFEELNLSRQMVDSRRNNAKLMDQNNSLVMELDICRASNCFAGDRVQIAEARVKALEGHVEASELKYLKTVEDAAQAETKLSMRVLSLEMEPKT